MAEHEFGMMDKAPAHGERYDNHEPEKYACISVDDDWIEPLLPKLNGIDFFWHSLDVPGKGLAYCGITLIPPESMEAVVGIIEETPGLGNLKKMLVEAKAKNRFVIHYGL